MRADNSDDSVGEQVADLLRAGSREQYDEVQKFVVEAMRTSDRFYGDLIMDSIWQLLAKTAQNKIGVENGESSTKG